MTRQIHGGYGTVFPKTGIRANPPGISWTSSTRASCTLQPPTANPPGISWTSSTFCCGARLVPGAWKFGNAFVNGAVSPRGSRRTSRTCFPPRRSRTSLKKMCIRDSLDVLQVDFQDFLCRSYCDEHMEYRHGYLPVSYTHLDVYKRQVIQYGVYLGL